MHYDVISFDSPVALARGVAHRWFENLAASPPGKAYCAALSGGRIAREFFAAVAALGHQRRSLFGNVHFFWADERCVPPDDAESNYALAQADLFRPLEIPSVQVHRIQGEAPPPQAAANSGAELCRWAPVNHVGIPVLDLVFLGMGEDGHIASLFPNAPPPAAETLSVYRPVEGPKPPPRRITMTFAVLMAAKQVWVLISGPGKERAFQASLSKEGQTPLARLLQRRGHTLIFVDKISILPVDASGH